MIPPQPPQGDLKLEGLTRQQIKKIQKSMKRPQFMGLLNQYMVQISDPKNKAQYDEYLKQMQRQGQLPKHMKLAKLKPQFCFRTHIISNRNKKHEMKFFINMCSSQFIEKPSCQQGKDDKGGVGYNWRVPNSIGKIRYDQDKHKNPCQVVDCAFHPDTFHFATHPSFQAMIISIALQGAEKQLGQRKETLSKDYVILKNIKCKGQNGQPALLPIRYIEGKAYNKGEGPAQQQRNLQGKQTKLQKQINKQKQQFQQQKQKVNAEKNKEKDEQIQQDRDDGQQKKKLIEDLQKGIQTPKFSSIYTYVTDYSQFIQGQARQRSLPNMFTVQFRVPRMQNISQANTLQINEKKIILSVQDKYYIDISFQDMKVKNYPLKYAQAKAKFDKKKKCLRVQIPVDISSIKQEIQNKDQITEDKEQNKQFNDQQNKKVIQQETWKNNILQIPEQQQTNKFLLQNEVQVKKQKKLVQQIDEDDYADEKQGQSQNIEGGQIVQKQYSHQQQIKRFSISSYYDKSYTNQISEQLRGQQKVQPLNFILKQDAKNLVIIIYMRNYKDEDVSLGFNKAKAELAIVWRTNSLLQSVHLCLQQKYLNQSKSSQIIKRVGFYILIVHKIKQGQLWGQKCINNKLANCNQLNYHHMTEVVDKLMKQQEIIKNNEAKQIQQSIEVQNTKPNNQNKHQQNEKQNNQKETNNQIDSIIENKPNKVSQKFAKKPLSQQKKAIESNLMNQKIPIQFIKFNVPFIEALN